MLISFVNCVIPKLNFVLCVKAEDNFCEGVSFWMRTVELVFNE